MDTTFENWVEWKEKCDVRRCGPETQANLLTYIGKRAQHILNKAAHATERLPPDKRELSGWYWWAIFDDFYARREAKTRKRIKDWLFQNAASDASSPADAMERQVCALFGRDVIREYVRECCSPTRELTVLDVPQWRDDPTGDTRKDVLTLGEDETRDAVAANEARQMVADYADRVFQGMDRRERVAVAATSLNLPHSAPEVERAAGCKKSVLCAAYKALFQQVVERLRCDLAGEQSETLARIGFYVFEILKEKAYEWARQEGCCAGLLKLAGDRTTRGNAKP